VCLPGSGALAAGQPDPAEACGGAEGGVFAAGRSAGGHGQHAGHAASPVRARSAAQRAAIIPIAVYFLRNQCYWSSFTSAGGVYKY